MANKLIKIILISSLVVWIYLFTSERIDTEHPFRNVSFIFYTIKRVIYMLFVFGTLFVWPFIKAEWISKTVGLGILIYYCIIDEFFRVLFNVTEFNGVILWETTNNINKFIIIPIIIYYITKRNGIPISSSDALFASKHGPRFLAVYCAAVLTILLATFSVVKLPGQPELGGKNFFLYVWLGIVKAILCVPLIMLIIIVLIETRLTEYSNKEFYHYYIMLCFIVILSSFMDWDFFDKNIGDVINDLTTNVTDAVFNLSSYAIYITQSIYFIIVSFTGKQYYQHIGKNSKIYELTYLFTIVYDFFSTLFIGISINVSIVTLIVMILTKQIPKKLLGMIFKYCCTKCTVFQRSKQNISVDPFEVSVFYLYEIVSNITVYCCIIISLLLDYFDGTAWIGNGVSNLTNLAWSIIIILITMAVDALLFIIVRLIDKKVQGPTYYSNQNLMKALHNHTPIIYFTFVSIAAQIIALQIVQSI